MYCVVLKKKMLIVISLTTTLVNTMCHIDYNSYRSVSSYNRRVRFLVMHYTAINFSASINALTGKEATVSAHYLVPNPLDITYQNAGFGDMRIFNLVDENERAWHAGVSSWAGRNGLNDSSIGIEIVNEASDDKGVFTFPPYSPTQIQALISLSKNILQRYPDLSPTNVVGHSDIAVGRKVDPGPAFPWKALYDEGVGAWYDEDTKQKYTTKLSTGLPDKKDILAAFKKYGYAVDGEYSLLVRAFQLHFRPRRTTGVADLETLSILFALVEKYFK